MLRFLCVCMCLVLLAVPVAAAEVNGDAVLDVTDPADVTDVPEEVGTTGDDTSPFSAGDVLSGGYYFVCDCDLGYDIKFYVPVEWAHDVFALDRSGALVNMSTSTCYAYCPSYPDVTFSCSRFGTFTYRSSNYTTTDLMVTEVSDTNLDFLDDEGIHLSDSKVLVLIAAMIFLFGAFFLIRRR